MNVYASRDLQRDEPNLRLESQTLRGNDPQICLRENHLVPLCESLSFVIFLFCVIVLCAFLPCLVGQKVLAPLDIVQTMYEPWAPMAGDAKIDPHNHFVTDAVDQFLEYQYVAAVSLKDDGYVGWNPLIFGGKPEYANTMGLYFDWTVQLHRLLGYWDAWHVGLFCQFVIAGIGMLLFLKSQSLSVPVCLAGAIAYAGNSQFVTGIYFRSALGSFCWVPWLLWSLERARSGSLTSVTGLSVITALALLGGSLQYDAFILLVILCVVLSWQSGEAHPRKVVLKEAGVIFASTCLALALAAQMLVPCTQAFLDNAAVGHHRGTLTYKQGWLGPVLHPIISICSAFPSALGGVRSLDLAKIFKGDYSDILYFGFLPVVIAFYCLGRKATPRAARFLMLFGLLLPLTPMEGLLYHRVSLLFIVGGVWAFADYWDKVDRESARLLGKRALLAFLAVSVLWAIASVLVAVNHVAIADLLRNRVAGRLQDAHFGMFKQWMMDRTERWVGEFPIWSTRQLIPWVLAGLSLLLLRLRHDLPRCYVTYALSSVLVFQVLIFASDWITLSSRPREGVLPITEEIERLKELIGNERVYLVPAKGRPPLFPPNTLATYGIATLQGYESIWPKTMWQKTGYAVTPEVLSKQAIRFAIVQKGPGDERVCWQPEAPDDIGSPIGPRNLNLFDAPVGVYARYASDHSRRYPNASDEGPEISGQHNLATSSCWPLIYRGGSFDVFRNNQAVPHYRAVGGNGTLRVEVISETFNHRRLRVPAGAQTVEVSENWSDGWRYRIDQTDWRPAIQSSDMSIVLPVLRSDAPTVVDLEFKPSDWGRRISIWAWLTVLALLIARTLVRLADVRRPAR